ncbi:MAG: hypothetical protein KIT73_10700 [Burkholderiales bacterium]|nr:hypothetical protein [Burkholderiales bacterium]
MMATAVATRVAEYIHRHQARFGYKPRSLDVTTATWQALAIESGSEDDVRVADVAIFPDAALERDAWDSNPL